MSTLLRCREKGFDDIEPRFDGVTPLDLWYTIGCDRYTGNRGYTARLTMVDRWYTVGVLRISRRRQTFFEPSRNRRLGHPRQFLDFALRVSRVDEAKDLLFRFW